MNDSELFSDDGFYQLDPRSVPLEQIGGSIFSGVFSLALLIGIMILWINIGFGIIWYLALAAAMIIVALLVVFSVYWPRIAYQRARWRLDDEGLEIHRGVLWRHRISIPLGRVQHADVSQGPLERQFGIGKLTVHTAGTQNASVELGGLAYAEALELRDRLVRQLGAVDVV